MLKLNVYIYKLKHHTAIYILKDKRTSAFVTIWAPASLAALLMASDTDPMPPSTCLEEMYVVYQVKSKYWNLSSENHTTEIFQVFNRTETHSIVWKTDTWEKLAFHAVQTTYCTCET